MKKHTFDPLSFVFGIIFLVIAAASLFTTDLDYRLSDWVLPASVLVLGIGLLAASFRGMKGDTSEAPIPEDHDPEVTDQVAGSTSDTMVE